MERKDVERKEEQCDNITGYKHLKHNTSAQQDERDEQIKNEPDTARIRSERQSVMDADNQSKKEE